MSSVGKTYVQKKVKRVIADKVAAKVTQYAPVNLAVTAKGKAASVADDAKHRVSHAFAEGREARIEREKELRSGLPRRHAKRPTSGSRSHDR